MHLCSGPRHYIHARCRDTLGFVYINLCTGERTNTCSWRGMSVLVRWYVDDGDDFICVGRINYNGEVCYMPKWKWLPKQAYEYERIGE